MFIHSCLQLSTVVALSNVLPSLAVSPPPVYYIDTSCGHYGAFPAAIKEAITMAGRATTRMADNTDTYFQTVFTEIFHTQARLNAPVNRVTSGVSQITQLNGDVKSSNIRIYCDQNSRWQLQADIPNDPAPNSGRAAADQIYYDSVNDMLSRGRPSDCTGGTQGLTYLRRGTTKNQPKERNTMTICQSEFNKPNAISLATLEAAGASDFTKIKSITAFAATVTVTVLHELTHCYPWQLDDVNYPKSYGWEVITAMSSAESQRNADSYAFFGLAALLKDKGFSIAFNPFSDPGTLLYAAPPSSPKKRRWTA